MQASNYSIQLALLLSTASILAQMTPQILNPYQVCTTANPATATWPKGHKHLAVMPEEAAGLFALFAITFHECHGFASATGLAESQQGQHVKPSQGWTCIQGGHPFGTWLHTLEAKINFCA